MLKALPRPRMVQAIVDPEEVRRFSVRLGRFNGDISNHLSRIQEELQELGSYWRDQEYRRFLTEFANAEQPLRRFIDRADEFALFLNRKAAAAEGYTNLRLQGLTASSSLTRTMNVSTMKESYDVSDAEARARHASDMVALYRGEHVRYKEDAEARKHSGQYADCSSFVAATLPTAFPLKKDGTFPLTSDMIKQIGIQNFGHNPHPGDIIMWTHHVGVVTSVDSTNNSITYANMSSSQNRAFDQPVNAGGDDLFEHIKKGRFGDGDFLGFWTPP